MHLLNSGIAYIEIQTIQTSPPSVRPRSRDRWTAAFSQPLQENGIRKILDLGCGVGYEAVTLLKAGYKVTGLDYSSEAISIARSHGGPRGTFIVADMAESLLFPRAHFDAVISNVAAHMFSDEVTRSIFAEIKRIIRPDGLFLFHLNSLEDRRLRAQFKPVECELGENYVLEQDGQTMHFFSQDYLVGLLSEWQEVHLEPVEILEHKVQGRYLHWVMKGYPHYLENRERKTMLGKGFQPVKRTGRGIARR